MKLSPKLAVLALGAALAFAGCSGGVEAGPVETQTSGDGTTQVEVGQNQAKGDDAESSVKAGAEDREGTEKQTAEKKESDEDFSAGGECGESEVTSALQAVNFSGHCKKLVITGSGVSVKFETADEIVVTGSFNEISGEDAEKIDIRGASNEIHVDRLGSVSVVGALNVVKGKVEGKIDDTGVDNEISG